MTDTESNETPSTQTVVTESGDISVYEAKIAELTQSLATKDAEVIQARADLTAAKAANYDLLQQIPVASSNGSDENQTTTVEPDSSVDIEDLFG